MDLLIQNKGGKLQLKFDIFEDSRQMVFDKPQADLKHVFNLEQIFNLEQGRIWFGLKIVNTLKKSKLDRFIWFNLDHDQL